jgi:hypothetical protein
MTTTTLRPSFRVAEMPLPIIERFLREREGVWQQINHEVHLNTLIAQMLASSTVALAGYGAVMGLSHSLVQALSSAIKLPILFLLTLAICLPTLYLFNLLFGGRLSAQQVLALSLSAITVTSVLTLAFAPIALFFLITAGNYSFYLLLNVAILTLTAIVGLGFLVEGTSRLNALSVAEATVEARTDDATPTRERPMNLWLLHIWLLLYGFVGTQLGWTLRPFFGSPDKPFEVFRAIEGNFYWAVLQTFFNLLFPW